MKTLNSLCRLGFALALIAQPKLHAEEDEFRDLYARQSAINEISSANSLLSSTRDEMKNQESGLLYRLKAHTRESRLWIEAYVALSQDLNAATSFVDLQNLVLTKAGRAISERGRLHVQHLSLRSDIEALEARIKTQANFKTSEQMASEAQGLNESFRTLSDKLVRMKAALDKSDQTSATIAKLLDSDLFTAKALKAAVASGIDVHAPQVQELTAYIKAEGFEAETYPDLQSKTIELQAVMYKLQPLKARDLASELETRCAGIAKAIVSSDLTEGEKSRLSNEVSKSCNGALNNYAANFRSKPLTELAIAMHQKNLKNMKYLKACNKEGPACSSFRKLQAVETQTIQKSNPEAISYLEQLWDEFQSQLESRP